MTWSQSYALFGQNLAVSAFIASTPILVLLGVLAGLRKPAWVAGLYGLGVALGLAIFGYHMPFVKALSSTTLGAAFGLFPISWIVFWAIALFRVTTETGNFEIIRDSIGRLTPDPRLQALLIAFAFGAFLEGAAGFGTPVAIATTMLVGLGFSPFRAAAICLLANTGPVAFGSIGIPVVTLAGTTGLPLGKLSAAVGSICAPVSFLIPAYLILATWGLGSFIEVCIPAMVAGLVFAGMQYAISNFIGPQLTDILASLSTMAALIALFRFWKPGNREVSTPAPEASTPAPVVIEAQKAIGGYTAIRVAYAWLPYGLLVLCVLLWGYKPFQATLNAVTITIRWPWLHDAVMRMPPVAAQAEPYHAVFTLNWLAAAGTSCMAATLLSAICFKISPVRFALLLASVVKTLMVPTATVMLVLAIAFLMNYCGATATLGLAFSATGSLFPFFSAMLGWLGVFLTGSDTSSNALFGNLQVVTAERLGFSPVLMAAANSVGGVMGKMISLQTIAVAAAATGMTTADQSKLFRFTLRHSLLLASIVGAVTMLYTYLIPIR